MQLNLPQLFPNAQTQHIETGPTLSYSLFSVDTHPSGRYATASANGLVRIWKLRPNYFKTLNKLDTSNIMARIRQIDIKMKEIETSTNTANTTKSITALQSEKNALLQSVQALAQLDTFQSHMDLLCEFSVGELAVLSPTTIRFSPNGLMLAIACEEGVVEIWSFQHYGISKKDLDRIEAQRVRHSLDDSLPSDKKIIIGEFNTETWARITSLPNAHQSKKYNSGSCIDITWMPDSTHIFIGSESLTQCYGLDLNVEIKRGVVPTFNSTVLPILSTKFNNTTSAPDQIPKTVITEPIHLYDHNTVNLHNKDMIRDQFITAGGRLTTLQPLSLSNRLKDNKNRAVNGLETTTSTTTTTTQMTNSTPSSPLSSALTTILPISTAPQLSHSQAQLLSESTFQRVKDTVLKLEEIDNNVTKSVVHDLDLRISNPLSHSLFQLPYQDYCLMTQTPIADQDGLVIDGTKGKLFNPKNKTQPSSSLPQSLFDTLLPTINIDNIVNRYFRNAENNNLSTQRPLSTPPQQLYTYKIDYSRLPPAHPMVLWAIQHGLYSPVVKGEIGVEGEGQYQSKDSLVTFKKDQNNDQQKMIMTAVAATTTTTTTAPIIKKALIQLEDDDDDDDSSMNNIYCKGESNDSKPQNQIKPTNKNTPHLTQINHALHKIEKLTQSNSTTHDDISSLLSNGIITQTQCDTLLKQLSSIEVSTVINTMERGSEENTTTLPIAFPLHGMRNLLDKMTPRPIMAGKPAVVDLIATFGACRGIAMDPLGKYLIALYEFQTMVVFTRNHVVNKSAFEIYDEKSEQFPLFVPTALIESPDLPSGLGDHLAQRIDIVDTLTNEKQSKLNADTTTTTTTTTTLPPQLAKYSTSASTSNSNRLFRAETQPTYYRRLDWSPDGLLLAVPAGILPTQTRPKSQSIPPTTNCVHIFTRNNINTPVISLPTPENQESIAVKFNPVPFVSKNVSMVINKICRNYLNNGNNDGTFTSDDDVINTHQQQQQQQQPFQMEKTIHPSITATGYYYLIATSTANTVTIYRSDSFKPILVATNLFPRPISDICWFPDGTRLIIASQCGNIAFITIDTAPCPNPPVTSAHNLNQQDSTNNGFEQETVYTDGNSSNIFITTAGEILHGFGRFAYEHHLANLKATISNSILHNVRHAPSPPKEKHGGTVGQDMDAYSTSVNNQPVVNTKLDQSNVMRDAYDANSNVIAEFVDQLYKHLFAQHYFGQGIHHNPGLGEDGGFIKEKLGQSDINNTTFHPCNPSNPINQALELLVQYLFGTLTTITREIDFKEATTSAPGSAPPTRKIATSTKKTTTTTKVGIKSTPGKDGVLNPATTTTTITTPKKSTITTLGSLSNTLHAQRNAICLDYDDEGDDEGDDDDQIVQLPAPQTPNSNKQQHRPSITTTATTTPTDLTKPTLPHTTTTQATKHSLATWATLGSTTTASYGDDRRSSSQFDLDSDDNDCNIITSPTKKQRTGKSNNN